MKATRREFWTTDGLLRNGVTVILFAEEDRVLAEVIGPDGHDDAILPVPEALLLAIERSSNPEDMAVLDDEDLWQGAWGTLCSTRPRCASRDFDAPEPA
ncbi:hypothetical protein [Roseomonas elaeocarpi]|uniref:Uncharacterized protein n=1 Tax=Roseomonas elaeocarpi TaxID=907779 RepID=A0ABV6JPS1_9PROT